MAETILIKVWHFMLLFIFTMAASFLGSYLKMKGKNLATKEDIEAITNKVESIKADYAGQLELLVQEHRLTLHRQEQAHELSVAALDKRLAAHQEAYSLWWELMGYVHHEKRVHDQVVKCQEWWVKNCLYLSPNVYEAFRQAYHAADLHSSLLEIRDKKEIKENWDRMESVGRVIVKAVALPSWGDKEYKPVEDKTR